MVPYVHRVLHIVFSSYLSVMICIVGEKKIYLSLKIRFLRHSRGLVAQKVETKIEESCFLLYVNMAIAPTQSYCILTVRIYVWPGLYAKKVIVHAHSKVIIIYTVYT